MYANLPDPILLVFLFVLGACVGSFLNVVIWRLPREESLIRPPSHCPKCQHPLAWYDNLPIVGWILLRGRCRYCREKISARYPILEACTGAIFAGYFFLMFHVGWGPCRTADFQPDFHRDGPFYFLDMALLSGLLAASLIDVEYFIIPLSIPWIIAAAAAAVHGGFDQAGRPGSLSVGPAAAALAAGAGIGLLFSVAMWWKGIFPTSFAQGEPLLEVDRRRFEEEIRLAKKEGREMPPLPPEYTRGQVRLEMRHEMLFLIPPLLGGAAGLALTHYYAPARQAWEGFAAQAWVSGLLGSVLGGLVGGFVVWMTRILGTLGFGRVAMGLGDAHLMVAVGAVLGAGPATVAFFIAPFFGIALAIYLLISGTRRELPYGPYLSLATAFVILFYCPIERHFAPGLSQFLLIVRQNLGS